MGVNSLPKTVNRQRHDCNLNPGPSAPESSALTTRLPSHRLHASDDKRHPADRYRLGAGVEGAAWSAVPPTCTPPT